MSADIIYRDFLITGHPRSGTGYAAKVFELAGKQIGHESVAAHGTSSWMLAVRAEKYPFGFDGFKRQNMAFGTVIHIMREPVACIASVVFTEHGSEDFRSRYVNLFGNDFERAVLSYCGWNKLIRSQLPDYTVKTENLPEFVTELFELKYSVANKIFELAPVNARQHPALTLDELKKKLRPEVFYEFEKTMAYYENTAH